jgi:hypothetical protein
MAGHALIAGLAAVAAMLTSTGCGSTSSNQGTSDGAATPPDAQNDASASNACTDASVKIIQASDYDQSCMVNTDCRLIAEGNACVPCAFNCPFSAAINAGALTKYHSDIANTPAAAGEFNGQTCASACGAAFGPCCVGGKCRTSTTSQCPALDAAGDPGVDAAADGGVDASAK